jgi:hypothetical protein
MQWTPPRPVPCGPAPAIGAAGPGLVLGEADGLDLLDRLGLATVSRRLLGPDEAIPEDLAYPVVLKAVSADLPHKTEAGAVALGLGDRAALEQARDAMRSRLRNSAPDARLEGWLIQSMVRGLGEALVGYRVDPEVGPVISVAPGGIFAELYEDVAVRTAPVDVAGAREMIAEVRGLKALAGWRGRPVGDLDALAAAVAALSTIALDPDLRVAEAEANPVMVLADGVVAVDALVRFA